MLLCDEVIPVIRVLVLNTRSNSSERERIFNHLAFQYYGDILNHSMKFCRSKHIYEHSHINYAWNMFGVSLKEVNWQKDWVYFPMEKNEPFGRILLKCSYFLQSKYARMQVLMK